MLQMAKLVELYWHIRLMTSVLLVARMATDTSLPVLNLTPIPLIPVPTLSGPPHDVMPPTRFVVQAVISTPIIHCMIQMTAYSSLLTALLYKPLFPFCIYCRTRQ